MPDLDQKLFACHLDGPYSESDWREILDHVVAKLSDFLEQPVSTSDVAIYPDGFAADIQCQKAFGGLLDISWFGRVGVTVLGKKEVTDLSAWLFFRGFSERLVSIDGKSHLYLSYRERISGVYEWQAEWDVDEFGEFEHWK